MTCWIEDDLHNEEHMHPPTYPKGRRPCSIYCRDGVHATVAFISGRIAEEDRASQVVRLFYNAHPLMRPRNVEPALEASPEMYPERKHYGPPPDPGEGASAWLVHFQQEVPGG